MSRFTIPVGEEAALDRNDLGGPASVEGDSSSKETTTDDTSSHSRRGVDTIVSGAE